MKYILPQGLIVSCQAVAGESLYGCGIMHLFARSAKEGGASAIRALCGDIAEIKKETGLPVIGLIKKVYPDSSVYITPTVKEVDELLLSGCEVIAIDATARKRHGEDTLEDLVSHIRNKAPNVALLADIATYEEAINAERLGFDYISTTLRGYTEDTKGVAIPDCDFIARCKAGLVESKLVVEGGIWELGQLEQVLKLKPYAVVIGTAITRPKDITQRFASMFHK